jgi:hypothetical protein
MNILGSKINVFIQRVDAQHKSIKEPVVDYLAIRRE